MQQNQWIPWETALVVLGVACAREAKVNKAWSLPLTSKELSIRLAARVLTKARVTLHTQLDCTQAGMVAGRVAGWWGAVCADPRLGPLVRARRARSGPQGPAGGRRPRGRA